MYQPKWSSHCLNWFVVPSPPESIRRDAAQKFTLGKSAPAVSGPEGNFFQLPPWEEIAFSTQFSVFFGERCFVTIFMEISCNVEVMNLIEFVCA